MDISYANAIHRLADMSPACRTALDLETYTLDMDVDVVTDETLFPYLLDLMIDDLGEAGLLFADPIWSVLSNASDIEQFLSFCELMFPAKLAGLLRTYPGINQAVSGILAGEDGEPRGTPIITRVLNVMDAAFHNEDPAGLGPLVGFIRPIIQSTPQFMLYLQQVQRQVLDGVHAEVTSQLEPAVAGFLADTLPALTQQTLTLIDAMPITRDRKAMLRRRVLFHVRTLSTKRLELHAWVDTFRTRLFSEGGGAPSEQEAAAYAAYRASFPADSSVYLDSYKLKRVALSLDDALLILVWNKVYPLHPADRLDALFAQVVGYGQFNTIDQAILGVIRTKILK